MSTSIDKTENNVRIALNYISVHVSPFVLIFHLQVQFLDLFVAFFRTGKSEGFLGVLFQAIALADCS